ncbi:MAG: hypothetical protein HS115_01970 [Spirochaetales bacterium]|nr:hypothetical protein [Spirochaetales bacterium]
MLQNRFLTFLAAGLITALSPGIGDPVAGPHTLVRLLNPYATVAEGSELTLAVHFAMEPDWHIYWVNPGESGMAPRFTTDTLILEKIEWPAPERYTVAGITNFVYHKKVLLPLRLRLPPGTKNPGHLEVEYLVCKIECIPGEARFRVDLPRGSATTFRDSPDARADRKAIEETLRHLPLPQAPPEIKVDRITYSSTALIFRLHLNNNTALPQPDALPLNDALTLKPRIEALFLFKSI